MQDNIFSKEEVQLLARCALVLTNCPDGDKNEGARFLRLAAKAGDRDSQLRWGLKLAMMDVTGARDMEAPSPAKYKEAIDWLTLAGKQGSAQAWYAIAQIYMRSQFSQRSLVKANHYITLAAEAGDGAAQEALGTWIWRTRKDNPTKDIQAIYWLMKAAAQGRIGATELLDKLSSRALPADWALAAQQQLTNNVFKVPQVLKARVALAARFGMSIPEALLIDPIAADHSHCLEIDIRPNYARGKRRIIRLAAAEDRTAYDDLILFFGGIDCSANGPEGNYQRRLYRLKRLVPDLKLR